MFEGAQDGLTSSLIRHNERDPSVFCISHVSPQFDVVRSDLHPSAGASVVSG